MRINIGEMTFGDILDRGMKLLTARFVVLFAIELIVLAPTLILQLALPEIAVGSGGAVLTLLPTIILGPIGSAALLHVITEAFQGRSVGLGEAFQFALSRFLPLLGTSILMGLGILLGLVFCIVPGIYLAIIWALMSQVVVVENLSGPEALSRSSALVQGYFWRVFGMLFLLGISFGLLGAVIGAGLGAAFPHLEIIPQPPGPFRMPVIRVTNYGNFVIVTVVPALVNILGQTYIAICTTLMYFDLRHRKDGFDVYAEESGRGEAGDWRNEPGSDMPPPSADRPPETGVKPGAGAALPPDVGIKDVGDGARPNPPSQE